MWLAEAMVSLPAGRRMALHWLKERRRGRIRQREFPAAWREIIKRNLPFTRHLSPADQRELEGDVQVFLSEKHFDAAGGLEMTDEIKVTIATQACILLLHRKTDCYPGLYSIIIYPHAYIARHTVQDMPGIITEGMQPRLGESWTRGAVVLSWDDVLSGAADIHDGHNVVFHEFAHQLDSQDGKMDGAPILSDHSMYATWARVLGQEYERLQHDTAIGRETLLDQYGATNPAEFFAVATEFFFEKPQQLREKLPQLYDELCRYYKQNPAQLTM
ncbi:MAG: M90 family metallopeptidase [Candidatus Bipolaricaulota bacterium]|nr:M90 family metallopeptidase [Candidatus Bipolaricaulota bacterium]